MGSVLEKCTSRCNKNEDDNNYEEQTNNTATSKREITMSINYNPIPTPENSIKREPQTKLFKNQFDRDPMEIYQIISQENNQPYKIVNLKNNPSIKYLIKIIPGQGIINDKTKNELFLKEAEKLQLLDSPDICKLYEVYIHNNNYYLICENYKENNLKDKITNGSIFDESSLKNIFKQILSSIVFLHEQNVFNIGLKLDNIVLNEIISGKGRKRNLNAKENDNTEKLKESNTIEKKLEVKISIVDYLNEEYERTDINDIVYYSPEIIEQNENNDFIKRNYKEKQNDNYINNTYDEWTCGIIFYYIISQEFPFKGETNKELYSNIKNGSVDFSSPKFNSISKECKDLISKLLEKDRSNRIKCNECFDHPFFSDRPLENQIVEELDENVDKDTLESLLYVKKPKSKYHEIITAYMCLHFLDKDEEKKLNNLFRYIDRDNKNVITEENIKEVFTINDIKFTQEDINNILNVFDYDQNNLIQNQEFLRVLCNKEKLFVLNNIKSVFEAIDSEKKNYLTIEDFKNFITNDENLKNKIGEEPIEPFGMKPEDKMTLIHLKEIMTKNKFFPDITILSFGKKKTGRKLK
jgi:serine/threonine protein kinase